MTAGRRVDFQIPASLPIDRCRSCGAAIVWTTTPAGKLMPLSVASATDLAGERRAISHFADCPHRGEWRRR